MMNKKYFYAVQVGSNYDWDYGSENYEEAVKIAEAEAADQENDGLEIRIAKIDVERNECEKVEYFREADNNDSPTFWS